MDCWNTIKAYVADPSNFFRAMERKDGQMSGDFNQQACLWLYVNAHHHLIYPPDMKHEDTMQT